MSLPKQNPFSKKVTDLPDSPSPVYSATEIKTYFQTPADELAETHNLLVDELEANTGAEAIGAVDEDGTTPTNVQARMDKGTNNLKTHKESDVLDHPDQSVTTSKIKDKAVTSGKIGDGEIKTINLSGESVTNEKLAAGITGDKISNKQIGREHVKGGAIGVDELDPAILNQPTTAFGQQAKFEAIDEQLAGIAINIKYPPSPLVGAKGGGVNDYAAIQGIIDYLHARGGGVVCVPVGTFDFSQTLVVPSTVSLLGVDRRVSVLRKTFNGLGIDFQGVFIKNLLVTTTDTARNSGDGIKLFTGRSHYENLESSYHGGNGIVFAQGNLSSFEKIYCNNNLGHGFLASNQTTDNNACYFGLIECTRNGQDGLHFQEGATSIYGSQANVVSLFVGQENGGYNLFVGTIKNVISVYAETNAVPTALGEVYCSSLSAGNKIDIINGNSTEVTDLGTFNQLSSAKDNSTTKWHTKNLYTYALGLFNYNLVGKFDLTMTADRVLQMLFSGSGSNATLNFNHATADKNIDMNLQGILTAKSFSFRDVTTKLFSGTGIPEGVVSATRGSLYLRTDGGAGTTLYVKESGNLATGWVAK